MGGLSIAHWLVVIGILFLYVFPVIKIVRKAGYSGWWTVLMIVPIANVVMLWIFAFARWPNLPPDRTPG